MLTNYFWNIALAESLFPTLHGVELALRNTIHTTLTNRYSTEEWWNVGRTLHPNQLKSIITLQAKHYSKYGVQMTPGQTVSELTFGFWVIILSGPHVPNIWRWKRFRLVAQAFLNAGTTNLSIIYARFNNIRQLRNRAMHHERLFDRPNLRAEHTEIHEAIQWISPDLHAGIHAVDSFTEIHTLGWERTYNKLHKMLGGP
jgi:hypothetical protein